MRRLPPFGASENSVRDVDELATVPPPAEAKTWWKAVSPSGVIERRKTPESKAAAYTCFRQHSTPCCQRPASSSYHRQLTCIVRPLPRNRRTRLVRRFRHKVS